MPVDLSPAGPPSPYPDGQRFWLRLAIWFVCNAVSAALVILLTNRGKSPICASERQFNVQQPDLYKHAGNDQ